MKKKILCLAAALLTVLLGACGQHGVNIDSDMAGNISSESITLSLCVDIPEMDSRSISDFFHAFPGVGSDFDITIETIPRDEANRETTLTRIRTEILAGEGPDFFLCSSDLPSYEHSALFPFPRQLLERRVFLVLDSYIKNAQYMEWDKLLPQVMEAGRNEEGQMLLPLTYSLNVFMFEKNAFTPTFDYPTTWEEMAESEAEEARMLASKMPFYNLLGEFADYKSDDMLITEDELFEYSKKATALFKDYSETASGILQPYILDGSFTITDEPGPRRLNLDDNGNDYWMISGYNRSGGATANILTFAGINRNTSYPNESFRILDYLLSKNNQASSQFYSQGLPVHMDLYSKDEPWHNNSMSQWNFEQFSRLRDEINTAKFYTPLDKLVRDAWSLSADEDELRKLVHKQYVTMQMMLAES